MLVHCVNSERSDEPAHPRSLVRAFARIHDTVYVLKQLKEDAFNHCCLLNSRSRWIMHLYVCLICCFTSQLTAMVMGGGGGKVSSPNHLFSWACLNKRLILQFREGVRLLSVQAQLSSGAICLGFDLKVIYFHALIVKKIIISVNVKKWIYR